MLSGEILLPTAYLPPIGYFDLIAGAENILIEKEENYNKQTIRNRCTILTVDGIMTLVVPVRKESALKTSVKDALIDYSKRWQQVHIGAIKAAYGRAPYFQFYTDLFEKIILHKHRYLLDLNEELLNECLRILKLNKKFEYTSFFRKSETAENDYRYGRLSDFILAFSPQSYIQVFTPGKPVPGLSIIDLIFNTGPDAGKFLHCEMR